MDMSLSNLWERVKDRKAWHVTVGGVTKSRTTNSLAELADQLVVDGIAEKKGEERKKREERELKRASISLRPQQEEPELTPEKTAAFHKQTSERIDARYSAMARVTFRQKMKFGKAMYEIQQKVSGHWVKLWDDDKTKPQKCSLKTAKRYIDMWNHPVLRAVYDEDDSTLVSNLNVEIKCLCKLMKHLSTDLFEEALRGGRIYPEMKPEEVDALLQEQARRNDERPTPPAVSLQLLMEECPEVADRLFKMVFAAFLRDEYELTIDPDEDREALDAQSYCWVADHPKVRRYFPKWMKKHATTLQELGLASADTEDEPPQTSHLSGVESQPSTGAAA